MAIEVERKFRITTDPAGWEWSLVTESAWELHQAYLAAPQPDIEVRIRQSRLITVDSLYDAVPRSDTGDGPEEIVRLLSVKVPIQTTDDGGVSRHELEFPMDEEQFRQAWRVAAGRSVHKVRMEYTVDLPMSGFRVITVDTFRGHLSGLRLAEIEFGSWADSEAFEPPGFLETEVTHDPRYRNAALAVADGPPRDV